MGWLADGIYESNRYINYPLKAVKPANWLLFGKPARALARLVVLFLYLMWFIFLFGLLYGFRCIGRNSYYIFSIAWTASPVFQFFASLGVSYRSRLRLHVSTWCMDLSYRVTSRFYSPGFVYRNGVVFLLGLGGCVPLRVLCTQGVKSVVVSCQRLAVFCRFVC